jgi:hypothetical protein
MNYLFSSLIIILIGMATVMIGILLNREPGQNFRDALADSVVWGAGVCVSFGVEFWMLANV